MIGNRMEWPKIGVTKARRRDFELQSSELWGNKNDLSAQLQIQLIGFETKSVPCFILKVSTSKACFFELFGTCLEGDAVGSTKGCARVCHCKMQCMTKAIQKLGHHASNLCFVGEGNSEHGFFELR